MNYLRNTIAAVAAVFVSGVFTGPPSATQAACGGVAFSSNDIDSIDWPEYLSTADTDRDGDIDILVQTWHSLTFLYVNNGDGSFSKKKIENGSTDQYYSHTTTIYPGSDEHSVFFIDFDNDGDVDITANARHANDIHKAQDIWWYENTGGNNFVLRREARNKRDFGYAINVDLNGDGAKDVLVKLGQHEIGWLKNNGSGDFTEQSIHNYGNGVVYNPIAADLDKDGRMDILYTYSGSAGDFIYWQKGDGTGNFSAKKLFQTDFSLGFLGHVQVGDINRDGDMDIIAAGGGEHTGTIFYLENNGDEEFTATKVAQNLGVGGKGIAIADFDKDGDLDFVQIDSLDDKVRFYKQECGGASNSSDTASKQFAAGSSSSGSSSPNWSISELNSLFRSIFGQNPTVSEWRYWASRRADKPQKAVFLGAMAYHKQLGNTIGDNASASGSSADAPTTASVDIGATVEVSEINAAFRSVYGRNPSVSEWTYWASRRGDKPQSIAFLGAMQWQRVNGITH